MWRQIDLDPTSRSRKHKFQEVKTEKKKWSLKCFFLTFSGSWKVKIIYVNHCRLTWLFNASSAIFPSAYLASAENHTSNVNHVHIQIGEALRVRNKLMDAGKSIPPFLYSRIRYSRDNVYYNKVGYIGGHKVDQKQVKKIKKRTACSFFCFQLDGNQM